MKNIQAVFKDREQKRVVAIKATIWDDKLKKYKEYRKEFEGQLHDLEKERTKIQRRKKNKKEKNKALRQNTIDRFKIICDILKKTFLFYQKQYYESDNYRQIQLLEIMTGEKILTEKPKPSALLAPNSQSSLKKGLDLITDFAKYKAVEKEEEKKLEEMKTEQLKENAGTIAEDKLKEGMKIGQKDGPKEGAAPTDSAAAANS